MTDPGLSDDPDVGASLLPCGRDPLDVIDRARTGTSTEHERSCPHCQGVITADAPSGRATKQLVRAENDVPVPDTLLPAVMRTVWSELRRDTMIPLATGGGSAFVAAHTVAAVIEAALDDSTDLQVHTCTVELDPAGYDAATTDAPAADPDPSAMPRIVIAVTAAAAYNSDVKAVATRARELVRDTVAEQFGWVVDTIDIAIVDVYVIR